MSTFLPPSFRDDEGLIRNVDYPRDTLGRVDWRKLVQPAHLYVSPEYQVEVMTRQNVKSKWDIDVTKCEDKELLITLAGLKYLAHLRGVESVQPSDLHVSSTDVTSVCTIRFSPNFENPDGLTVGAQASASVHSVSGKFQLYLSAMAQNRAYTRAVKEALRIEILGFEEVDFKASRAFEDAIKAGSSPLVTATQSAVTPEPAERDKFSTQPFGFLEKLCVERGITFEKLKVRAIELRDELEFAQGTARGDKINESFDPANWTGFNEESIMPRDAITLIDKIKAAKKAKK